jgi:hypothetical protein
MIKIEKGIPVGEKGGRPWKYKEYIDAFLDMDKGDSFVVDNYKIVNSVRKNAWKKKVALSFRKLSTGRYRIWKV